jgi:hypothetical protein
LLLVVVVLAIVGSRCLELFGFLCSLHCSIVFAACARYVSSCGCAVCLLVACYFCWAPCLFACDAFAT